MSQVTAFVGAVALPSSCAVPWRTYEEFNRPRPRLASRARPPTMIRGFRNQISGPSDDVPVPQPERPKRAFDSLVDFPCVFTFKVVGLREGEFLDDIRDAVARVLKTEKRHLKTSFRDRGKYRSITLSAPVNCAEQIYDVYEVIDLVCLTCDAPRHFTI
jgi:putative lipoic acid-binding regulatory protein